MSHAKDGPPKAVDAGRAAIIAAVIGAAGAVATAVIAQPGKDGNKQAANPGVTSIRGSAGNADSASPSPSSDEPEPNYVANLRVPLTDSTSINLSDGKVQQGGVWYSFLYTPQGGHPVLEYQGPGMSVDVRERSWNGCIDALDTRPNANSISTFAQGDAICASDSGGVSLLVVTSAPDADGTLGLRITHWPS